MPQNLANIDGVLKDWYEGAVRQVINFQARIVRSLRKSTKKWSGRQVKFPFHLQRSNAVAYGVGGETSSTSGNQLTDQMTIPLRQLWGIIRVTHDAMEAARDDRGSFERAVSLETKSMTKEIIDTAERSIWGDGGAKLGEVESISSQTITTSTLSDSAGSGINGNADNRYVRIGMRISFYTSGGVPKVQGATVSSVNIANGTFVFAGGLVTNPPAAGDGIFLHRPDTNLTPVDNEPMGISGVIDDGSNVGTLHGLSRTTYPILKSQVLAAGTFAAPGTMTEDLFQRGFDAAHEGGLGDVSLLACHYSTRREVLKFLTPDRRYTKPGEYAAGFKENKGEDSTETLLTINEVPIVFSKYCPWRTLYGWHSESIKIFEYREPHWIRDGNGSIMHFVPGINATFEAQMAWMYNVGPDDSGPNSAFRIDNINVSNIDRVEAA